MVAFFVNMEWSGEQQIQFLLQSVILGGLLGLCLDVTTSLFARSRRREWLWTDVIFGPFAAVVTFLGALVIMDGQLHPLLLFGVFLGMITEHLTMGVLLTRIVRYMRCRMVRMLRKMDDILNPFSQSVKRRFVSLMGFGQKSAQNEEKP